MLITMPRPLARRPRPAHPQLTRREMPPLLVAATRQGHGPRRRQTLAVGVACGSGIRMLRLPSSFERYRWIHVHVDAGCAMQSYVPSMVHSSSLRPRVHGVHILHMVLALRNGARAAYIYVWGDGLYSRAIPSKLCDVTATGTGMHAATRLCACMRGLHVRICTRYAGGDECGQSQVRRRCI